MTNAIHRAVSMAAAVALMSMVAVVVPQESASSAPPKAAPTLSASASTAETLDNVTLTGAHFSKRSTVTITVSHVESGATTSTSTVITNGSGGFTAVVTVPAFAGDAVITARTPTLSASVRIAVVSPVPLPAPTPEPSPVPDSTLRFGVSTPQGPLVGAEIDAVTALVGEQPTIELWYEDFTQPLSLAKLAAVDARGAQPLITWEPWVWGGGTTQPEYRSAAIAAGAHDDYVRSWGATLAAWGKPVLLRYGHEMNGTWYPWADGVNGNRSGDYVAAWRHVHSILKDQGATNVRWVWSPNVPYDGSTPLAQLYPGADVVDVVALDGYNWGTSQSWSSWQSPEQLFGAGLSALRALAPHTEIVIAETASSEAGGSKANWNAALVTYLDAQPDVTGFVWFDHQKETDWRIASSADSASSVAAALTLRN